jgi:hypothetical protein
MTIAPDSPHLLEALTRAAPLTALALWGGHVAARRDALGRVWAAQGVAAVLCWAGYYVLDPLQLAKEKDDTFCWLRFVTAVLAAVGAWDLARRAAKWRPAFATPPRLAAALCLVAAPATLPFWWDPQRMDPYFTASLEPVPRMYVDASAHLRAKGCRQVLLVGDPQALRWIAALTGCRGLLLSHHPMPGDYALRFRFTEHAARGHLHLEGAEPNRWGATHLVLTPEFLRRVGGRLDDARSSPRLREELFAGPADGAWIAVFAIGAGP